MKEKLLILLIIFLSVAGASFACGCGCKYSPSGNSNCQKACQNIFSLIALDLSLLSPRAAAADVSVKPNCCELRQPCCIPQQPCCTPQPPCCTPQPPCCPRQSMGENQDGIIPVCNKTSLSKPCANEQAKTSLFRIDLFRLFKIQIK